MLAKAFKTQLTPMEDNCCKRPTPTKEVCGYLDSNGKFFYTASEAEDSDIAHKIHESMRALGYGYSPTLTDVKNIINRYIALKPRNDD